MKLNKYHTVVANTSLEEKENIRFSMAVLERLNELLERKFDGKQKLLADKMGKSEAEVSKWFSGVQNFTIKTLIKLQLAFEEPIIAVCPVRKRKTVSSPAKSRRGKLAKSRRPQI